MCNNGGMKRREAAGQVERQEVGRLVYWVAVLNAWEWFEPEITENLFRKG